MKPQNKQRMFSSASFQNNLCASAVILSLGGMVLLFLATQSIISFYFRRDRALWSENFLEHYSLYESIYSSRGSTKSQFYNKQLFHSNTRIFDEEASKFIQETYSKDVLHCEMTIVFMDPRLGDPSYSRSEAAWFALESVAYAFPEACVLLLVAPSYCFNDPLKQSKNNDMNMIRSNLYHKSLPMFRKTMIESGRVRMSMWNLSKYRFNNCSNVLSNPSRALMNVHFWTDEFIETIDNDLVLIMQNDSVWCSTEDTLHDVLAQWEPYAYVGAPWPVQTSTKNNNKNKAKKHLPSTDICHDMSTKWNVWLQHDFIKNLNSEQRQKRRLINTVKIELQFPDICESGKGPGPVGRGGLSLRSRQWMTSAILNCPHLQYSGIPGISPNTHPCEVVDESIDEGLYFSVVLRGIGAPLPHAVQASLFAFESVWPEDAAQAYGDPDQHVSYGGTHHLYSHPVISWGKRHVTMAYGVYKAWEYFPDNLFGSKDMDDACPLLKYVRVKR
jgi:hypothetical protein